MKLLNKTLRSYFVYSFTILLVTIPLFYFVVRSVLLYSVDRSLRTQLADIRSNLYTLHTKDELEIWVRLDKDISLSPINEKRRDSIYTIYRLNIRHRHPDMEPYREIAGVIEAGGAMYRLVITSSLVENEDLLGSILLIQTVLLILLMAGMLWINQRISKKIWLPFHKALNNMHQYKLSNNTTLTFSESNTDEFNELNTGIKNMLDRNYEVYSQQKEFTENASHEMQTPLAIFQSKLELLMQTNPLNEEQAGLITDLENTNQRLIKLNKSLLLLTKIESNQYGGVEDVNVNALTKKITEQLVNQSANQSIAITTEYHDQPTIIKANGSLVEILLRNLIANAIRHNITNGRIYMEIDEKRFIIQNTGVPKSLNAEKIFVRFHKEEQPSGSESNIGIGLSIVKEICELYGYTIAYSFNNNLHQFTIIFSS